MAAPVSALVTITRPRAPLPRGRRRASSTSIIPKPVGLRLIAQGTFNSSPNLALVTIQLFPAGTQASTGEPWYTTRETILPDNAGGWSAYVQQTSTLSNPMAYYLITEWFYDGSMRTYKARIPTTTAPTIALKDVLI